MTVRSSLWWNPGAETFFDETRRMFFLQRQKSFQHDVVNCRFLVVPCFQLAREGNTKQMSKHGTVECCQESDSQAGTDLSRIV